MSKIDCPLSCAAKNYPSKLAVIGDQEFSFSDLNKYCMQLQQKLKKIKHKSIATTSNNALFIYALLFACLREKKIFFPLSFRLPIDKIENYLKEANAYLTKEIDFDDKTKLAEKKYSLDLKQTATYLLTSGSSSAPKICAHSLNNHYASACGSNEFLNYSIESAWHLSLPLFHVGGLSILFRSVLALAKVHISQKPLNEIILNKDLTHLSLIPTQLYRLKNQMQDLKHLKCILLGGALCPETLYSKAKSCGLKLQKTYGLTEMSSQVSTDQLTSDKNTILPYSVVTISEDSEILVKGQTLFLGYLKEGNIISAKDKNGWFHTGDLGKLLNGHLEIIGRVDNLFISGGENIQPEEVEKVLLSHPNIREAIVMPLKDKEFGHRPVAYIKTDQELSVDDMEQFLERKLEKFKWPIKYFDLEYDGLKPSRKNISSNQQLSSLK